FKFEDQVFATRSSTLDAQASIPRLWATRKIGYLLNEIRLHGAEQELVDQIVRLSIRYGIVTPYTSYLVTEPMPLGVEEQERIAEDAFNTMQEAPLAAVSGREAVEKAADQGAMQSSEVVISSTGDMANLIRIVGAHTFVFRDGIWVDTAWDPASMETTRIAFLSDDYFALVRARPLLGAAFALGDRVIALSDGIAYEVVPSDDQVMPVDIPDIDPLPQEITPGPNLEPDIPTNGGRFPCLSALLPLVIMPLALVSFFKDK
ncbi:MAG: hypothetical protein ABFS03_07445, partial [Chloroflexota bacterium]